MGRMQLAHTYEDIVSLENLLEAWREFSRGKRRRLDVMEFERNFIDHVIALHEDLAAKTYRHSPYEAFHISDPKPRSIHKALDRFRSFAREASRNHTMTVWVLKCDIRKFFASIDQTILLKILKTYIPDRNVIRLLSQIVGSFSSGKCGRGLPLGNPTSQLLVNVYMNEFDQFVKHRTWTRYYLRYADDFVFLSRDRAALEAMLAAVREYLRTRLRLELHPDKVSLRTFASGIDFLGWVHFPDHRVLRTVAKRRMMRRLQEPARQPEVLASYRGLLAHGNTLKLQPFVAEAEAGML